VTSQRQAERAPRTNHRAAGQTRPRVTVITPAYNVANYIGEAIDSVLGQSISDFEYLIIDDGSSDRTVDEILHRISEDNRARLITMNHAGASAARNAGILQARGDFISFLDGDDRWHPKFLEKQLALLESLGPDVAAVFARARVISESGRVYLLRWQRAGRYDFDDMLIRACPPRTGSSLLIRASAFSADRLFRDLKSAQDLDMWLRIQRDSGMPYFWGGNKYLLDIRVRPGAISRDHRARFAALESLIRDHSPDLRRHPPNLAYVRPSVFAYRSGEDDVADRWAREVRQIGLRMLVPDSYGWRVLAWSSLTPWHRKLLRSASGAVRSFVGCVVGAGGAVLR
jgi:glycosyltransferase involved in cell wall biosynthesis